MLQLRVDFPWVGIHCIIGSRYPCIWANKLFYLFYMLIKAILRQRKSSLGYMFHYLNHKPNKKHFSKKRKKKS